MTLLRAFFLLFLLALSALLINILSEDVKLWMAGYFGTPYLWFTAVVLGLITLIILLLQERKKGNRPKNELAEQSTKPDDFKNQSTFQPFSRVKYNQLKDLIEQDHLEKVLDELSQLPDMEGRAMGLKGRLAHLEREVNNFGPTDSTNNRRNRIRDSITNILLSFPPVDVEPEDDPKSREQKKSGHNWRVLSNPKDAYLSVDSFFLGREKQLKEYLKVVEESSRALTITGMAGSGKTSICHRLIADWLANGRNRITYVLEAEFLETVEALQNGLAELARMDTSQGVPDQAEVLNGLAALPPGLLYIDNLESAIDDEGKTLSLLQKLNTLNNLKLLGSSRRTIASWNEFQLGMLDEDDAVSLFRLHWADKSGYDLPSSEDEALRSFVQNDLGCHPLSISILASHARAFPDFRALVDIYRENSGELEKRFATVGSHRLDSLDFTLGLSLDRLDEQPQAKLLLALCSLFQNGLSPYMQRELMRGDVFDYAARATLFERHLVNYDEQNYLVVLPPTARFVQTCLADEQDHRLQLAELFVAAFPIGMQDHSIALSEHLDFVEFFAKQNYQDKRLYRIDFYWLNLYDRQVFRAREILDNLIARPDLVDYPNRLSDLKMFRGQLEFRTGDPAVARGHYEQAMSIYQKTGSELGQANVQINLGQLEFRTGDPAVARGHYEQAMSLYQKTGYELGQANVQSNLGQLEFITGDPAVARGHYEQAMSLYQKTGYELGQAYVQSNLGELEFITGDPAVARGHYEQAMSLYQKTGSEQGQANVQLNLGELEFRTGDPAVARGHYEQAMSLYQKTGSEQGQANVQLNLGELEFRTGDPAVARGHYEQVMSLYQKTGDELGQANVQINLGELEFRTGDPAVARGHYEQAMSIYQKTGSELGQANVQINLGELEFTTGDPAVARGHYEQAMSLYQKTGSELGQANVQINLGELEFRTGDPAVARGHYEQAMSLYQKTGYEQGQANVQSNLGELEFITGDPAVARGHYEQAMSLYQKTGDEQGQAHLFHFIALLELGEKKPEKAKENWAEALQHYRRSGSMKDTVETLLHLVETQLLIDTEDGVVSDWLAEAQTLIEKQKLEQYQARFEELVNKAGERN